MKPTGRSARTALIASLRAAREPPTLSAAEYERRPRKGLRSVPHPPPWRPPPSSVPSAGPKAFKAGNPTQLGTNIGFVEGCGEAHLVAHVLCDQTAKVNERGRFLPASSKPPPLANQIGTVQ